MDNTSFAPGNKSVNNSVPPAPQYAAPERKHFVNKKFIVTFVILLLLGSGAYASIRYWQNDLVSQIASTHTLQPSVRPDSAYVNSLISTVTNWDLYKSVPQDAGQYPIGSDPCEIKPEQDKAMEQYLGKVNLGSNVKKLDASYVGVAIFFTPNYLNWSNGYFLSLKLGCSNGASIPLVAYPDKLLWVDTYYNEIPNNQEDADINAKSNKVRELLLDYFEGDIHKSADASTWKTYRNEQYGYEIKYPIHWNMTSSPEDIHLNSRDLTIDERSPFTSIEIQVNRTKPKNMDIYSYAQTQLRKPGQDGLGSPGGNLIKTTFNGYPAVKAEFHGGEGPAGPGYFVQRNATSYVYILVYLGSNESETDQILSTFKFTK
jgi:hypothetical protein